MALIPMGSPTAPHIDSQESMFEDPTGYSDAYELSESIHDPIPEDSIPDEPTGESTEEMPDAVFLSPTGEPAFNALDEYSSTELITPAFTDAAAEASQPIASSQSPTLPLTVISADDFAALEERILRAVTLVLSERQARAVAEERAATLEASLAATLEARAQEAEAQNPVIESLQQEVNALRVEREQVRQRVERLLNQLDALEL